MARSSGPMPLSTPFVITDGQLLGFAKITRDLTERRQTQLELEKSNEQLMQSQKMEAIGHLTGGIAHDFNNMLTGISGSLELMDARLAQGRFNDFGRYIASARGAAARAAALTHRLLAFARRQPLDPKAINANKLIASMEEIGAANGWAGHAHRDRARHRSVADAVRSEPA